MIDFYDIVDLHRQEEGDLKQSGQDWISNLATLNHPPCRVPAMSSYRQMHFISKVLARALRTLRLKQLHLVVGLPPRWRQDGR